MKDFLPTAVVSALLLAALRSQIMSNLEQAWELSGGSEDQLTGTMMQISQVVTCPMSSL